MIDRQRLSGFEGTHKILPKPDRLRWEIGMALLIKIVLLTGLWFLVFRWPDKPADRPDIAERFALPSMPAGQDKFLSQPPKEPRHVR